MAHVSGPFGSLFEELKAGRVTRRQFLNRAIGLGVAAPVALFVMNTLPGGVQNAYAQDAAAKAPDSGTEGQTRGSGGELKLLQWQSVSTLNNHRASGTKDSLGASFISEPLLSFLPDGTIIPALAAEVPTTDNGGVSADLKTVTFKLKEGVLWSDGQPFTAEDVVFTWQWVSNPDNTAVTQTVYDIIEKVEAPDPLTAVVTYKAPSLTWYSVFCGTTYGTLLPKHVLEAGGDANAAFESAPIGTGPYVVDSFKVNDQVIYKANPNYREPNKPFFDTINLKGGGEATSAAQAVLQTGDWDLAWNLQVEPQILLQMEQEGGKGKIHTTSPVLIERVVINFSDPSKEVDGQRSEMHTPHPFLTDKAVRQAMTLATDRQTIADQFYLGGDLEPPARNILTGIPSVESANTTWEFNLDAANKVLDDAGWTLDGDTRKKDGVELKIAYATSINGVRQKTQAVNKDTWGQLGIQVQLKEIDGGIFFGSEAGNEQNYPHMYWDIHMYAGNPTNQLPLSYMQSWYAGKDGVNIAQKSNGWAPANEARYNNPEYDAVYDKAVAATDPEEAAQLFIQMNDIVINDYAVIPLVARANDKYAALNTFNDENVAGSLFEVLYWNSANWNRVAQ